MSLREQAQQKFANSPSYRRPIFRVGENSKIEAAIRGLNWHRGLQRNFDSFGAASGVDVVR